MPLSREEVEECRGMLEHLNLKELTELLKLLRQVIFERAQGV